MNLFFQATSLCIDKKDPNIVFAGVGPTIIVIQNQKIIKSQKLFDNYMRILLIQQYPNSFFAYAENILLQLLFSYQTFEFQITNKFEFPDILKAIEFSEEKAETKAILGHGQIAHIQKDNLIHIDNPPNWKIITAASIQNGQFFYADSFGTLTYINHFNFETEYGGIFCISQNFAPDHQIITAHESKAAVLWNVKKDALEKIWECKDFPSRVFGCNFFKGEPIIFSEDACVHYRNQVYQLHRSKTVTSLAINGDTVVTSGQYGTIRYSNFSNTEVKPLVFDMKSKQLITTSLIDGTAIYGTFDGNLVLLPEMSIVYEDDEESGDKFKKGWFLMSSLNTTSLCFSRDKKLLFYSKNSFKIDADQQSRNFSVVKLDSTAASIALSEKAAAVVLVDNSIKLFRLPSLIEFASIDLSDDFPSPPSTVAVIDNDSNTTVAVGSLAVVLIIEFDKQGSFLSKMSVDTDSGDDFISLHFTNCTSLFCGGKSNGIVSIIEKVESNEKPIWMLKAHWRVPWQLRSIVQICSYNESPIVCVLAKDSIVLWDILTQTNIGKFSYNGKKNRVSVQVKDGSFTASCCDGQKAILFSESPCLSTKFVGPQFHGLRILSSATSCIANTNSNKSLCDDLLVTGSCDRDIRLWRVGSNGFEPLDCVYGSTDGTHSLCFGECSSNLIIFSGGSKNNLIGWIVKNNKIFLLKEFVLNQFGINTKVNFTVSCCSLLSVENKSFLFVGSSDAFLNVFQYDFDEKPNHIELIERKALKGTPMSIDKCDSNLVVAESTGDLYFSSVSPVGESTSSEVKISNCGVLMARLFKVSMSETEFKYIAASSCDDGNIILTDFETQAELLRFKGLHSGGIRSLAVSVDNDGDQKIVSIASFSYDQRCMIHKISFPSLQIVDCQKFDTSIFDGERVEFVKNHVVVLGSGMEMFS